MVITMEVKNITLRGKTYHFRLRIPEDCVTKIGKKEIVQSLKTGDQMEAGAEAKKLTKVWAAKFAALRKPGVSASAKPVAGSPSEDADAFRQELLEQMAKNLPGILHAASDEKLRDLFDFYKGSIQSIRTNYGGGLDWPEIGIHWPVKPSKSPGFDRMRKKILCEVLQLMCDAVAQELGSDEAESLPLDKPKKAAGSQGEPATASAQEHNITEVAELMIDAKRIPEKTALALRADIKLLKEWCGGKDDVATYTKRDLIDFTQNCLPYIPANMLKKRAYAGKSLRECIALTRTDPETYEPISYRTCENRQANISMIFNYAKDHLGLLAVNPAKNIEAPQVRVARDLMTNAYDSVQRPLSMLVTKWGMDQLTDRCVVLQFGNRNLTYIKLENGSYMPPPGETAELYKENNRFVLKERFGTTYTFNTNGFLDAWRDADSNTLSFAYSNGRLQSATDAFGRSLNLTYNASNLLYTVSDSTGRQISFAYDTAGNLTNYTDTANLNWGYEYNTNNLLTVARDPEGIVTIRNFYDSLGCVTQQVSATSNTWRFSIGGNQGTEKDPFGNQTVHWFDDDGRNLGTQDALGNRDYTDYDVEGQVLYTIDRNENATLYIHDNKFNLTRTVEAFFSESPRETFFDYDELNHLRVVTNAFGTAEQTVTEYTYTATHHIDTITEAKGTADERVTDLDYTGKGLLQKKTEGNGTRITEYIYDNYGTPDTVTSTDAGTVDYLYDARGDLKEKKIDGITTAYFYDPRRLLTNTVYAVGTPDRISESRIYWNNGLLKTVTDARDKTTRYFWTPAYKQAGVVYPDTGSTTNLYDAADRLTHTRDAKQNWTEFQVDALGRVTNTVGAITTVSAKYDAVGNVTNTVTDPAGLNLWTRTAYDEFNRPFLVQKPLFNLQYFYDQLGRMTNRIDAASKPWKTEYDALGQIRKAYRPSGNYEEYGYSALGSRSGFWNAEHKPMTFGVDAQGRVTAITNAITKKTSFTYNDAGNLTDRLSAKNETTHYDYNALNRLTNVVHEGQWKAAFVYDANGNVTEAGNQVSAVGFAHDAMNRLTNSSLQISGLEFQVSSFYDLNGNRTNIVYPGGLTVSYDYNEENRMRAVTMKYTNSTKTFAFGYDDALRLNSIAYPNGVNATVGYDAESRITNYVHGAFLNHTITRDPRGFKTQEDISAGLIPNFTNGLRQTRTHNDADQLLTAGTGEYSYDPNGNLTNSAGGVYSVALAKTGLYVLHPDSYLVKICRERRM